jgi:hypothetical protein
MTQKLLDLLSPHDRVRVAIRKSELEKDRISRLFGVKIGPGRNTVDTSRKGALRSHRGKPQGYVKPNVPKALRINPDLVIPKEFKR